MSNVLDKIVRVGIGQYGNIFCRISVLSNGKEEDERQTELSITGVEAPTRDGDARGSCGQIVDSLREVQTFAPGWTPALRDAFVEHWRAWHLNGMRAGCKHQRAEQWEKRPLDPAKPTSAYVQHPDGSSGWNMLTWVPEKHGGLLGKACPVCGYKYGTAWLYEPLPDEVLSFMRSLPDTDIQPAWV